MLWGHVDDDARAKQRIVEDEQEADPKEAPEAGAARPDDREGDPSQRGRPAHPSERT